MDVVDGGTELAVFPVRRDDGAVSDHNNQYTAAENISDAKAHAQLDEVEKTAARKEGAARRAVAVLVIVSYSISGLHSVREDGPTDALQPHQRHAVSFRNP